MQTEQLSACEQISKEIYVAAVLQCTGLGSLDKEELKEALGIIANLANTAAETWRSKRADI